MKCIMFQGTSSHVGKTLLTMGLCHLLYKKGKKVAPFKPQNITSNLVRLENGDLIGGAQYLQGLASGIEPDARLNPVAISIGKAQCDFIINGKLHAQDTFDKYTQYLDDMKQGIRQAYISMSQEYDYIIVEGAGSPTEINRRTDDISNMWFAEGFDIPVILVSNIEYGGAWASLVGTMELLEEKQRQLVKGYIMNKFDGEDAMLASGVQKLQNRYGIRLLGSMPYCSGLNIPEEDDVNGVKSKDTQETMSQSLERLASLIENRIDLTAFDL